MTHRNILVAAGAAAVCLLPFVAEAQINSPKADGYLERAVAMAADNNARGTIDQSLRVLALYPTSSQREAAELSLAMAALRERDASAPFLLDAFAAAYPESAAAAAAKMAAADWFFALKDYPEALRRYAALAPSGFNDAEAAALRFRHGVCLMMMADYAAAAPLFEAVSHSGAAGEYGPASVFYLGYIAYRNDNYNEALKRFEAASAANPSIAAAANTYIAQIRYSQGDNERALAAARKVLKEPEGPFHPEARRIAGESLYNLGQTDEAVPLLWIYAQAVDEPAPTALYILGTDEFRRGHYSESSSLLSRAAADPSAMGQSASLMLGHAYLAADRTDAALLAFERAMNAPYDTEVAENAAYNHAVASINGAHAPFASSVAALESFLDKYPNSDFAPTVQEYIVDGYMADRNYEQALASIDHLTNPSQAVRKARQRVVYALGSREYGEAKYTQALKHFKEAAASPYGDKSIALPASLWQGITELSLERPAEAVKTLNSFLKEAPDKDPDRAVANYHLGYALWDLQHYPEAAKAFAAVSADKSVAPSLRSDALARQADASYLRADFAEAAAIYAKAHDLNPASADYPLFQQAIMLGLMRDHKGKIETLDRFADQYPSSALRPDALLERAESQVALGNNDGAIATYQSLTDLYPASAASRQGRLRMAVTRLNSGQEELAIADYKAIISDFPSSSEARTALDDLKNIYASRNDLPALSSWLASVNDAPELDPSDLERLAFSAAEKSYMEEDNTARLATYLKDYPQGANYPKALYYMAEAAALSGDFNLAFSYADRLLSDYPDADTAPDALLIRADSEAAAGKTEAALASYSALAEIAANPSQLSLARLGILRAATDLKRNDTALRAADDLLASTASGSKNRNEVMLLRGIALDRLGHHEEAYAQWEMLISAAPDDINAARASVAHASSLFTNEHTADAHKAIDRFINSNPPSQYWLARAFILLSDILRAEGNDFEADEYLISLRNNYPGNEADILDMIDSRLKK
ncbi:MAG: tetratricopeptide repeat protein [Pseudoflavonifractor sp.]|nr:tetratricopeptide repeat protein [Alloprevotella sp.]MCM1117658.1 tetratricopeptide repeat protein [Pseudoflavonifractor sp.]